MSKCVVWGFLIGVLVGIAIDIFFPRVLNTELIFNIFFRKETVLPLTPQYPLGSVFAVGDFVPLVLGLLGSLMGYIIYKVSNIYGRRK
jgi:hypothetical protein